MTVPFKERLNSKSETIRGLSYFVCEGRRLIYENNFAGEGLRETVPVTPGIGRTSDSQTHSPTGDEG